MSEKTATTGRSKTAVAIDRILEMIDGSALKPGDRLPSERALAAEVTRDGKEVASNMALNDVVVDKGAIGRMIEFELFIDGEFIYNLRSDGLIVSTPTGSTAYALSVGGPMIYPSVACTLLIPVAPHSLANRPIVIPENSLIEITVTDMRDATLYFDMQDNSEVLVGDIIKASPYPHRVKILHPSRHNYFDTLCKKLHWNYLPTDR